MKEKTRSSSKAKKYLRLGLWVLLVQFLLVNISAALYAYRLTHVSDDPSLANARPAKNIFVKTWRLFSGPRQVRSAIIEAPGFGYDTVHLITAKQIPIEAWYARSDSAAQGTVMLFHGVSSNKSRMLQEAEAFRMFGYNVMLLDLRAHGNSGGNTITFGVREVEEVKLAYDFVKAKGEKNIFLWGSSMGAVVVTKAVADYPMEISGIILEAPFASLQTHLQARARAEGFRGFPEKPFGFLVGWWMGVERGFKGHRHKTTSYIKKIAAPVLLQWGALDQYVMQKETDKIYNAISSGSKKLIVYGRAGHESLLQNDPLKWKLEVQRFLQTNSK